MGEHFARTAAPQVAATAQSQEDVVSTTSDLERLSSLAEPKDFLSAALAIAVEQTHATSGYIAVFGADRALGDPPLWEASTGLTSAECDVVRNTYRSEPIATMPLRRQLTLLNHQGRLNHHARQSVSVNRIISVLAASVGAHTEAILHLQGRKSGVFGPDDESLVRKLSHAFAPRIEALLTSHTATNFERAHRPAEAPAPPRAERPANPPPTYREAKAEFRRKYILAALKRHNGNMTNTARALGLPESRMFALVKYLNFTPDELASDPEQDSTSITA